ncbi:MAG: outer membrane beta-barrel protein [Candidatus Thiodiazotropha sp.]
MDEKHLSLTLASMFLLSSAAYAQGGYFGFGIGNATYSEDDFDESNTGFNFYGGFRASENFGVELSYTDFGKQESNYYGYDASVEVTGLSLSAVGFLPVSDNVDLFGKIGLMS